MRSTKEEDAAKRAQLERLAYTSEAVQALKSMDSATRKTLNERLLAIDDPARQHLRDTAPSIGGVLDASQPLYTALEWYRRLYPGEELRGRSLKALRHSVRQSYARIFGKCAASHVDADMVCEGRAHTHRYRVDHLNALHQTFVTAHARCAVADARVSGNLSASDLRICILGLDNELDTLDWSGQCLRHRS